MIRRLASSAAVASMVMLAIAATVSAHIDPIPTAAQAGSRLTVGFTVEHGCEGSPTVQLDMRLPDGVVDAVAEPFDGWRESISDDTGASVVTFVGGPLPDDVEATFEVTMTLPPTPDVTIYFPFVQRCEVGEIRWIGIPSEPGDELAEPAPAMSLIGPVATTVVPAATVPATIETAAPETAAPETAAPETAAPETTVTEATLVSAAVDEAGDPDTGTIIFIVSVAAVLGIGAFVVFRSRQSLARQSKGRRDAS